MVMALSFSTSCIAKLRGLSCEIVDRKSVFIRFCFEKLLSSDVFYRIFMRESVFLS